MTHGLAELQRALERYGLLLEHDKVLPSVTSIVAGAPIAGSWWGHPLGHQIYELIGKFEHAGGALSTKIVNAKVTYVHERLWPAFFAVARAPAGSRLATLSPQANELFACVQRLGKVRADAEEIPRELAHTGRELTKAVRALEGRLLICSDSLHTESGAHVKVLRTWEDWCSEHAYIPPSVPLADAKRALNEALAALCKGTELAPKVPW